MRLTRHPFAAHTAVAVGAALAVAGLLAGPAAAAPAAAPASTATVAAASAGDTIIRGTSMLARGEAWYSPDGRTMLAMQGDGHAVLYHDGVAIWTARGSYGVGNQLYMQADGNLVVYDAGMRAVWNSQTHSHTGAYLAVQNAGNLVVYYGSTPLWWSNFRPGGPGDPEDPGCLPRPGRLCP
ncbi:hypothetical protein ACIQRS_25825 [Streptomyces termitum]|uniref:Bulb-type lectin domain-containing protein n=1 Tax=Streptomyces termitum TaxID=67368 RepID=A0A918T941_9ACTN|nr:hypothetical protein [Streptomyces termitum]GHB08722.1 hypothetical protein GCM10010305_59670 [Streptomyces termitum]